MGSRLEFHNELCELFVKVGKWLWNPFNFETNDVTAAIRMYAGRHVYFQQPGTERMEYPCIIYSLDNREALHADDIKYRVTPRYTVTIMDYNPDSEIPEQLEASFQYCRMNRKFVKDNLHHFVYTIYY